MRRPLALIHVDPSASKKVVIQQAVKWLLGISWIRIMATVRSPVHMLPCTFWTARSVFFYGTNVSTTSSFPSTCRLLSGHGFLPSPSLCAKQVVVPDMMICCMTCILVLLLAFFFPQCSFRLQIVGICHREHRERRCPTNIQLRDGIFEVLCANIVLPTAFHLPS